MPQKNDKLILLFNNLLIFIAVMNGSNSLSVWAQENPMTCRFKLWVLCKNVEATLHPEDLLSGPKLKLFFLVRKDIDWIKICKLSWLWETRHTISYQEQNNTSLQIWGVYFMRTISTISKTTYLFSLFHSALYCVKGFMAEAWVKQRENPPSCQDWNNV